ncbi:MAG: carboxyl-terminal processing protease [Arcticibacterium sp.]|jgi:carboxyl-terminal processing protease
MKDNHIKFLFALLPFLFLVSSCKEPEVDPLLKDDDRISVIPNPTFTEAEVNLWIHGKMKEYYLWEDDMKIIEDTDLSLNPDSYFESLLVNPGEVDRFSWIEESSTELRNSLNGLNTTFGFKYRSFYANSDKTRIAYAITYSLKNSAADKAGIQRGDFITKVNGVELTPNNYRTALSTETATFTKGTYSDGTIISIEESVEVTKEQTQSQALHYYTVLEMGDKKIGYFVYNQFLTSSNGEVNDMFAAFRALSVDELVVDFRFNPGGYISSAEMISSLIVKDLDPNKLMTRQIWNNQQMSLRNSGSLDTFFSTSLSGIGNLNNLGTLNRVYFLVSNGSASASELVINNLKPHMDVILIGEHTYGKNVGSITIDDSNSPQRWAWGMQPIVLKSVNSLGKSDYGSKEGFLPDVEIEDKTLPFRPFGDPQERILEAALEHILGSDVLAKAKKGSKVLPTAEFEPASDIAIYGEPLMDRAEMWITEFPWNK